MFSRPVKKQKGQIFLYISDCFRKPHPMSWFGVLAYIIHLITGTSLSEDDFRPTDLAIILSSWSQISRIVREYQPINIQSL